MSDELSGAIRAAEMKEAVRAHVARVVQHLEVGASQQAVFKELTAPGGLTTEEAGWVFSLIMENNGGKMPGAERLVSEAA